MGLPSDEGRLLAQAKEKTFLRRPVDQLLGMALRRWADKGYTPNVDLSDLAAPPEALAEGEVPVARVRTTDGRDLYLTDSRIVTREGTLLEYGDLSGCRWITGTRPASLAEARRLKAEHFDRLILERHGGEVLVLDRLDQAVFPLLRFFGWMLMRQALEHAEAKAGTAPSVSDAGVAPPLWDPQLDGSEKGPVVEDGAGPRRSDGPATVMGRFIGLLARLAAFGGIGMSSLSIYPGVLVDLVVPGILLSPLWVPAVAIGLGLYLAFGPRPARGQPARPDLYRSDQVPEVGEDRTPRRRRLLTTTMLLVLSLALILTGIPRRAAFLVSRPAFRHHVATAPTSEFGGEALGLRLGVYDVDRYAADPRGGVYSRTHSGPDGFGPDEMSYGFAFRPNPKGSPFGNAGYHLSHTVGDWYCFSASNDW